MQTVKTAVVVAVLLAVGYGAYQYLHGPETVSPPPGVVDASDPVPPLISWGSDEWGSDEDPPADDDGRRGFAPPKSLSLGGARSSGDAGARHDSVYEDPRLELPTESSGDFAAERETSRGAGNSMYAAEGSREPGMREDDPTRNAREATDGGSNDHSADDRAEVGPRGSDDARSGQPSLTAALFPRDWERARVLIEEGKLRDALKTLSVYYNSPDLSIEDHRKLLGLLDPLAGKVIYSTEHLVLAPHAVGRSETLADVAQRYQVPPMLLQNINGIKDPNVLVVGTELKVVPGPFRADVDLTRRELTLFLDELYAGRFPISVGQDPVPREGEYQVREKQTDRIYYSADGLVFPPEHKLNPYGNIWIDLGHEVCIHGAPESTERGVLAAGCISLSPLDAHDVYAILSQGSKVTIRR